MTGIEQSVITAGLLIDNAKTVDLQNFDNFQHLVSFQGKFLDFESDAMQLALIHYSVLIQHTLQ